jgi:serine/threonine protein kinase
MRVEVREIAGVEVVEKRLTPRELHENEAFERLRAEATLLRVLAGRVTPRLVEAGEDERGPFVRTARVPFPTLAERLASAGAGLGAAFLERAATACFAALADLHEAADESGALSIVHADLSPANIAIGDDGRVVILDLGLALFRGAAARDGAFRGTVAYAAPELARGEAPTTRSDLFSLAATLLHGATGAPPRSPASLASAIVEIAERPIAIGPAALALGRARDAVARCLAHEPSDRPASAREVLSLLPRPLGGC